MKPEDYPLILNTMQAAKLLRCGRTTIYKLAEKRIIPAMKYGKGWKFNRDALLRVVANGGLKKVEEKVMIKKSDLQKVQRKRLE
ncbi:MAG: Helix-turn-helix domain [Thermosediminibacterales bacterium]|nr:Helix-turn-helix domain [Thermosediminibacterales bacterium]